MILVVARLLTHVLADVVAADLTASRAHLSKLKDAPPQMARHELKHRRLALCGVIELARLLRALILELKASDAGQHTTRKVAHAVPVGHRHDSRRHMPWACACIRDAIGTKIL